MAAPPTCPPGIRLVRPGDERAVFDLMMLAFQENGWGNCDPTEVRAVIAKAIAGQLFVIGVIPGPDGLEAVIGFQPARCWYADSNSWWYSELLVYVHPEHRRSRHFATLMRFTKWFEHIAQAPVLISVMPRDDFERKQKAFSRHGKLVTATFLIGSGEFRYAQAEAA